MAKNNKKTNEPLSERPLSPIPAAAWDKRQHQKNVDAANDASRKAAMKEISASRDMGREGRTGMMESGLIRHTGGLVSGLVDTGTKQKKGSSW